ncbi:MAG: branched-chain amino acid ABC transporter permease [Bradyrhizobiaceae bacterium]|nr:branched-chain amino acid ABC transporter permease [Bradyrhizobiaceae bacterium]
MTDRVVNAVVGSASRGVPMSALARYGVWVVAAAVLAVLPFVFGSGLALTVMSLMGIAVIFSLSYNILLGQTGLLSFGHAVYYGFGGYLAVHAMKAIVANGLPVPLPVIPLVGGLAGLFFAALFGWVSTKRSGTAFAMISLGLAELIGSSALILRGFFGGEEGITADRTKLLRILDWSFGPQVQVYYLIAVWCLLCAILMYAVTRTPLGRMCNAVRDNPERVQFVGYDPRMVRFLAFCLSGLFAGVAGALAAINFEIANSALFGAVQSGTVLLATFMGGAGFFFGPVLGAVLVVYLQLMLSDLTGIWQLYFGLLFIAMVMFAPSGLAGLIMMHRPLWRARALHRMVPAYFVALVPLLVMLAGAALMIEMFHHLMVKAVEGPAMKFMYIPLHANAVGPWLVGLLMAGGGFLLFHRSFRVVAAAWNRTGVADAAGGRP